MPCGHAISYSLLVSFYPLLVCCPPLRTMSPKCYLYPPTRNIVCSNHSTVSAVSGCLGPCVSMNNKAGNVGETEIGVGGTSQWKFCSLTPNTTPVIALEIVNQVSRALEIVNQASQNTTPVVVLEILNQVSQIPS